MADKAIREALLDMYLMGQRAGTRSAARAAVKVYEGFMADGLSQADAMLEVMVALRNVASGAAEVTPITVEEALSLMPKVTNDA